MAAAAGICAAAALHTGNEPAVRYISSVQEVRTAGPIAIQTSGPVNANTGGEAELCTLKGIGPALAQRIIEERAQNGRFYYPEDLISGKGIGRKTLTGIREQLDLSIAESGDRP